ncbi:type II toxin-antitoxin system RelE/ParE family toxin [Streptomyces capillispiralis]|uniref:type II toxin-antitoxin system RelE family toxin n=1 Tax=Streptomyces capillispiralis TaxID=68182 RepID=UPI0036CC03FB
MPVTGHEEGSRASSRPAAMRVLTALTALGDDPYRQDADVKKLTGPSGLHRLRAGSHRVAHRLRVGSHRVAHRINDGELVVLVVEMGGRRDVHRDV